MTQDEQGQSCAVGRVRGEMESVFGDDRRRIDHALAVLKHAEAIRLAEGGSAVVITAAALLHDIGMHAAERKHHSTAGRYQEIEGPPIAREILTRLGFSPEDIEHVCRIVASHHSGGDIDTPEFRAIWDADWLVNIPAGHSDKPKEHIADLIGRVFRTATGRRLAEEMFLA